MKKLTLLIVAVFAVLFMNAQSLLKSFSEVHNLRNANQKLHQLLRNFNPLFSVPFYKNTGYSLQEIHNYNGVNNTWQNSISGYFHNYNEMGIPTKLSIYDYSANDTVEKAIFIPSEYYWDSLVNYVYEYPTIYFLVQKHTRFLKHLSSGIYKFVSSTSLERVEPYGYRITGLIELNIDPSGNYTDGYRDTIILDENRHMLEEIEYSYDPTTQLWQDSSKYEYTTNNDGYITKTIIYLWDNSSSEWKKDKKYVYTLNGNNTIICTKTYNWSTTDNQWIPNRKDTIILDPNTGNIVQRIYLNWSTSDNQYINSNRDLYTYNTDGTCAIALYQYWDNTNGWVNNSQEKYEYQNGHMIADTSKYWDNTAQNWVNLYLATWIYDNDLITSFSYLYWDETNNMWVPDWRELYTYNKYNQMIKIYQNWDNTISQWINDEKYIYNYTDGRHTSYEYYSWNNDQWEKEFKETYTWKEVSTSVNDLSNYSPRVYPNPVDDIIYIPYQKAEVEICNTNGQIVVKENTNNGTVNVENLNNGLYIIKMNSAEGTFTSKFIKQ